MSKVIGYSDEGYAILGDEEEKETKYRLIKVGDKYVIQKGFTFTKNNGERVTNYSDVTDLLDYETAKAKMLIIQGKYEVVEKFSA